MKKSKQIYNTNIIKNVPLRLINIYYYNCYLSGEWNSAIAKIGGGEQAIVNLT